MGLVGPGKTENMYPLRLQFICKVKLLHFAGKTEATKSIRKVNLPGGMGKWSSQLSAHAVHTSVIAHASRVLK